LKRQPLSNGTCCRTAAGGRLAPAADEAGLAAASRTEAPAEAEAAVASEPAGLPAAGAAHTAAGTPANARTTAIVAALAEYNIVIPLPRAAYQLVIVPSSNRFTGR
jgi:hypothetical protein